MKIMLCILLIIYADTPIVRLEMIDQENMDRCNDAKVQLEAEFAKLVKERFRAYYSVTCNDLRE